MTATTAPSARKWTDLRADFPILARTVRSKPLIYLDSAATSHKPTVVLSAMDDFYRNRNAAVHRGAHALAEEATEAFEGARTDLAHFFGADDDELIFTSNATAGINLVAYAIGNASAGRGGEAARRFALQPGDRIVVTEAEHHANLVPWQELAARSGAELRWIELDASGRLRTEQLPEVINERTKVVAFTHASNVTGAITDVAAFVAAAAQVGAITVLDAAQSAPHMPVDFHALGVDFAVVAGHKMLGPTGIGLLYGRRAQLADLPPVTTGGSMVEIVTMTETTYQDPPQRFEAGTQMVAEAVGLRAAAAYLSDLGMTEIQAHEHRLTARLLAGVAGIEGVKVLGPTDTADRLAVVSVAVDGVHSHDVGQLLDAAGIAVRVGHHCAQPVHRAFGEFSSTRASVGPYTTEAEADAFAEALAGVQSFFGVGK